MSRLPPAVIQKWSKVKHELVPVIDKMKGPTLTDEFKKDLKKKVTALYDQFDGGLKKSLKAGAEAKTDKDAVVAISQAHKTATDYKKKTAKARAEWGTSGGAVAKSIESAWTISSRPARARWRRWRPSEGRSPATVGCRVTLVTPSDSSCYTGWRTRHSGRWLLQSGRRRPRGRSPEAWETAARTAAARPGPED